MEREAMSLFSLDVRVFFDLLTGECLLDKAPVFLELLAMRNGERETRDPSHSKEYETWQWHQVCQYSHPVNREIGSVIIIRAAFVHQVEGCFSCVQDDHVSVEDL
jgi:hypothetical protein